MKRANSILVLAFFVTFNWSTIAATKQETGI
jgi:hypothetical protein